MRCPSLRSTYACVCTSAGFHFHRQVLINVQPQPVVVHQSFRIFCASEQPLVRWLFVDTLPPKKTNPQQAHELGIQIGTRA